jgi:hypothetical protein
MKDMRKERKEQYEKKMDETQWGNCEWKIKNRRTE